MYEQYQKEILEIQEELKRLPKGHLVKRRDFYYWSIGGREKGITRNHNLISQLARKAYLKERLKRLTINGEAAKLFDKRYQEISPFAIIKALSGPYENLPRNYFFEDPQDTWSREKYKKAEKYPESLRYLTNAGVLVRSKSEMLIGNALERKKIAYRYEAALELGEIILYPDFTAKHPLNGKLIFWEHLGLLDRPDYDAMVGEKLNTYADFHIFPGRDLICTCEADTRDSRRIEGLIDLYFGTDL